MTSNDNTFVKITNKDIYAEMLKSNARQEEMMKKLATHDAEIKNTKRLVYVLLGAVITLLGSVTVYAFTQ